MKIFFIQLCFLIALLSASKDWKEELGKVKAGVEQIKEFMKGKDNKGKPYIRLAYTTDTYGHRLSGSDGLERAIDLILRDSKNTSLDVKKEKVMVPTWQEACSSATLHSKFRTKSLSIVAYGPSVPGKLIAPILLVKSFEELVNRSSEAVGKIVVYNQECQDYQKCVQYRNDGAWRAAEHGAVASLTRSVTPYSNYNPHTGPVIYKGKRTIPAAAITVEDAAFIERIVKRDPNATIDLYINTVTGPNRESSNLIIDILGTDSKDEILLSGTHTDSWHIGDGVSHALGCNILYEAMRAIRKLDLKPKRTLRLVLFTAGEQDSKGEKQYLKSLKLQKNPNEKIKLVMKVERGAFNVRGLIINNGEKLKTIVQEIFSEFFKEWNLTTSGSKLMASANTLAWFSNSKKIPRLEFLSDTERYLAVYNSAGDTLDKLKPEEEEKAVTFWASVLYTLGTIDSDFS